MTAAYLYALIVGCAIGGLIVFAVHRYIRHRKFMRFGR